MCFPNNEYSFNQIIHFSVGPPNCYLLLDLITYTNVSLIQSTLKVSLWVKQRLKMGLDLLWVKKVYLHNSIPKASAILTQDQQLAHVLQ